jgi:hypothetical protein
MISVHTKTDAAIYRELLSCGFGYALQIIYSLDSVEWEGKLAPENSRRKTPENW